MTPCPSREQLERLLAEQLGAAESETLDGHLGACDRCQSILAELSDGPEVARWRQWGRLSLGQSTEFLKAVRRALPPRGLVPTPPTNAAGGGNEAAPPGNVPAGYEVLGVLGHGAAGVVYKARQVSLGRLVALKLLRSGALASPAERARFFQEAEAVARLQHPHLVQIFEVGERDGLPFLALEYVEGGALSERLAGAPQLARQAAELVEVLARAVHFAHERGIVHRDLKPANILLAAPPSGDSGATSPLRSGWGERLGVPGFGLPKVADFGLAKRLDGAGCQTETGAVLGTPSYMAPEQAQGRGRAVGPAADVHALGAILYELLTGRPPFQGATPFETLLQVVHHDPVPPSRLQPGVPPDLDTICLKCLRKEASQRYASALDLAADLARFLAGRPIFARPVGPVEGFVRWCRRKPGVATLGFAFVLTLLAGTATALFLAARSEENARLARTSEQEAHEEKAQADLARETVQRNLYHAEMILAGQAAEQAGGLPRVNELLAHWMPAAGEPDRRGWEWYYLRGLGRRAGRTFLGHGMPVRAVAWSPDGNRVASVADTDGLRIWDVAQNGEVAVLRTKEGTPWAIGWSPDGRTLATACRDGTLRLHDANTGRTRSVLRGHMGEAAAVAWSPDGKVLATGDAYAWIRLWDPATGREIASHRAGEHAWAHTLSWSPDGRRIAYNNETWVRVLDVTAGRISALRGHSSSVREVSWSPDGLRLASAADDQTVRIWDMQAGKELAVLRGHCGPVHTVCWSPDSSRLASGGADHTVRVWDAQAGGLLEILRGHLAAVTSLRWMPDGTRLVSAGEDATVKLWDVNAQPETLTLNGHGSGVRALAWSPDGRRLASAGNDPLIHLWDPETGEQTAVLRGHIGPVLSLSWGQDGRLASGSVYALYEKGAPDHMVKVWDAEKAQEVLALRNPKSEFILWKAPAVCWSPDGRRLATVNEGWTACVRIWDVGTGREVATLRGHETWALFALSWGRHGLLASGGQDALKVWDDSGREVTSLNHRGNVYAAAWSPDGDTLAGCGPDGIIRLWERGSWKQRSVLSGHTGPVLSLAWHPDGRRLASGSDDHTVKVWDTETTRETLTLRGFEDKVLAVCWSPDGNRLASGSFDGKIHIWDASHGYAAESSPHLLTTLERRFQTRDSAVERAAASRLRARVRARQGRWEEAAAELAEVARRTSVPQGLFLAGWWLAGPFAGPGATPDLATTEPDPTSRGEPSTPSTGLTWRAVAGGEDGRLLLRASFPRGQALPAYLLARIHVPAEQPIVVMTTDVEVPQLWLNGRPVPGAVSMPLTLRAGWNTLVFAVRVTPAADWPVLVLSEALADRLHALVSRERWEEAAALAAEVLASRDDGPILLEASRAFRGRAGELRRLGQSTQAEAEDRLARSCCERLLARHPDHAGYAVELAEQLLDGLDGDWVVLEPLEVKSANGATLRCLPDHSILASGKNPDSDTYTFLVRTLLEGVTAVRLEALPHPSLPQGGSGRYPENGNFNLSEFAVSAAPAGARGKAEPVPLAVAWSDYAKPGHAVHMALDGNPATWWETWPRNREAHTAIFSTRRAVGGPGGTLLTFRLDFSGHAWKGHGLGRFRLSVTKRKAPLHVPRWRSFVTEPRANAWARLGVAYGLAEDWEATRQALEKAVTSPSAFGGHERAWLALASARLGRQDAARKWQTEAVAAAAKSQPDEALKALLLEVAEALRRR
jgi:WD40 repeat protein